MHVRDGDPPTPSCGRGRGPNHGPNGRRRHLLRQFLSNNKFGLAASLLTFVLGVWIGRGIDGGNGDSDGPLPPRRQLQGSVQFALDPKTVEPRQQLPIAVASDSSQQQQPDGDGRYERDVHVGNMCRCGNFDLAVPARPDPANGAFDTRLVQPPSKATGPHPKHYYMHSSKCECKKGAGVRSHDKYMWKLPRGRCERKNPSNYNWWNMPDFGVEELPLFMTSLSYESPLPLNISLHNYLEHDIHRRLNIAGHFIQLNHRSEADDQVMAEYQRNLQLRDLPPPTVMGSPDENLHPGLTIARSCRAAEAHPRGHPNGENLLLFLEKDWSFLAPADKDGDGQLDVGYNTQPGRLEDLFRSANALAQRGVPYIRLAQKLCGKFGCAETHRCPSMGVDWECTRSSEQRWSNQPVLVDCRWFLRYLEPFALLGADDGIMMGCRPGMQEGKYCDWEEAGQDGRVAWVEAQWTMALLPEKPCDDSGRCYDYRVFSHHEEGGK